MGDGTTTVCVPRRDRPPQRSEGSQRTTIATNSDCGSREILDLTHPPRYPRAARCLVHQGIAGEAGP